MVNIQINNNQIKISAPMKIEMELRKLFAIRHPNQWYLRKYMPRGWDGMINYITDAGYMHTGLLPQLFNAFQKLKIKPSDIYIDDLREGDIRCKNITCIEDIKFRPYQLDAIYSILKNKIDYQGNEIHFQRGILKVATNGGKTLIALGLYEAAKRPKTLLIINGDDLYRQALVEIPPLIPEEWGYIEPKKIKWGNFMICKVHTMRNRLPIIKNKLAEYEMCIIDECDLADNKTYKAILEKLYNCTIRVGMSGTALMGKLAKYKIPHQNIKKFFGEMTYEIKNIELIEQGHSCPVTIKIIEGNVDAKFPGDYDKEYELGIVKNPDRNKKVSKRIKYNCVYKERIPALVIVKKKLHVKKLYRLLSRKYEGIFNIAWAHSGIPDKQRKQIMQDFKEGKIDILVSSLIIKRGMNFPLLQYTINAGGGDDPANPLQILGRNFRKHKKIKRKYYEDFKDAGTYLSRHSKHRINYYKDEGLEVKILDK